MLASERIRRILELGREYAQGWEIEATTEGYKLTQGSLVVRFLEITPKYGDYYSRVLIYDLDVTPDPLYVKRTNISDDLKIQQEIEYPLDAVLLAKGSKQKAGVISSVVKHFRHALHKQADEEQEEAEDTFEIYDGEQSLNLENWPIVKQREVVAGFAVKNGYTLLFGDAGVGKSLLAHNIGLYAASGLHYLGFTALLASIKVLYLSLEMYYDEFRERHNKLLEHFPETARSNFLFLCPPSFDFTNSRDRSLLTNTIEKQGIKLLIADSHNDWRGDKDMNDNTAIGTHIVVPIMEMMRRLDFSTILLHHTGWQGNHPTGAKVLWNNASVGILMEGDSTNDNLSKIAFKKWRNTARKKPRPISLRYDAETYLIDKATVADLMDILDKLNLPAKSGDVTRQIRGLTDLQERQAREKKYELIKMGVLIKDGKMIRRKEMGPISTDDI